MFLNMGEKNYERAFCENWGISIKYRPELSETAGYVVEKLSLKDAGILNHVMSSIPKFLLRNCTADWIFKTDEMLPCLGIAYMYDGLIGLSAQILEIANVSTGIPSISTRTEVIAHEIGHTVDCFLCLVDSLGGSSNWLWHNIEAQEDLQIPNRKPYDQTHEDWTDSFVHCLYNTTWFSANFPLHYNFFLRYVFYPMHIPSYPMLPIVGTPFVLTNRKDPYEDSRVVTQNPNVKRLLHPDTPTHEIPLIKTKTRTKELSLLLFKVSEKDFVKNLSGIKGIPQTPLYLCIISECKDEEVYRMLHGILFRNSISVIGSESTSRVSKSIRQNILFGSPVYWRAVISEIYQRSFGRLIPEPKAYRKAFSELVPTTIKAEKRPKLTNREKAIFEELKSAFKDLGRSVRHLGQ